MKKVLISTIIALVIVSCQNDKPKFISEKEQSFLNSIKDEQELQENDFDEYGRIMDKLSSHSDTDIWKDDVFLNLDFGMSESDINDSLKLMEQKDKVIFDTENWIIIHGDEDRKIKIILGGEFYNDKLYKITLLAKPFHPYEKMSDKSLKLILFEYFLANLCSGKRLISSDERNGNAVSYCSNVKYELYYNLYGARFDMTDMTLLDDRQRMIDTSGNIADEIFSE